MNRPGIPIFGRLFVCMAAFNRNPISLQVLTILVILFGNLLLASCQYITPQNAVGAVTRAVIVEPAKAVSSAKVKSMSLQGRKMGEFEDKPCYLLDNKLILSFEIDSFWKRNYQIKWQRGKYEYEVSAADDKLRGSYLFPVKQLRNDLGDQVAGEWTAILVVKGSPHGSIVFRVTDPAESSKLLAKAKDMEAHDQKQLALSYWKRSFEADPISDFWKSPNGLAMMDQIRSKKTD